MPRRLRQVGRLHLPVDENGIAEGIGAQPNPIFQQASEEYMKQMSQAGRDAVSSSSHAGLPSAAHRGPSQGSIPTSAEALASLRITAKVSAMVSHYLARARKGSLLAGRLLLTLARSSEPLTVREERILLSIFLRDPAWVPLFPELARQCQRQVAARLGVPASGTDCHLLPVRRAANPRHSSALAAWLPGSGALRSRPAFCCLEASLSREDLDGVEGASVVGDASSPGRRFDACRVMTMESICSDLGPVYGLQTFDSLPDMVEPEHAFAAAMDSQRHMPLRTADSLPDIMQIMGTPSNPWHPGNTPQAFSRFGGSS